MPGNAAAVIGSCTIYMMKWQYSRPSVFYDLLSNGPELNPYIVYYPGAILIKPVP